MYYIILHYIILHYVILYYITLHYIALYYIYNEITQRSLPSWIQLGQARRPGRPSGSIWLPRSTLGCLERAKIVSGSASQRSNERLDRSKRVARGSDERFRSILDRFWTILGRFWTFQVVDFGGLSELQRSIRPTRSKKRRPRKNL